MTRTTFQLIDSRKASIAMIDQHLEKTGKARKVIGKKLLALPAVEVGSGHRGEFALLAPAHVEFADRVNDAQDHGEEQAEEVGRHWRESLSGVLPTRRHQPRLGGAILARDAGRGPPQLGKNPAFGLLG